jgi:glycosyltransferase involved in cell wall biosynthesis
MRLVLAIDSLRSGGAQRQVVELARVLAEQPGLSVTVLTYVPGNFYRHRIEGTPVHAAQIPGGAGRRDPRVIGRIAAWLRDHPTDVVHAFVEGPIARVTAACAALPRIRRPAVIGAERTWPAGLPWKRRFLRRVIYGRCDALTVNSRAVSEQLAGLGVPRAKIHFLANGIDLDRWDVDGAREPPWPMDPDRFNVMVVGGMRPEKGHQVLLAALALLPRTLTSRWTIWVIGDNTGTSRHAREVRSAIAAHPLADQIEVRPATQEIAACLTRANALVMPSTFEGFPNVLLEAMASRLPAVATRVGEAPEMIAHGVTGLLTPPDDPVAMAEILRTLAITDRDHRAAMGAAARLAVEQRYTIRSLAERHLALYRRVAAPNAL